MWHQRQAGIQPQLIDFGLQTHIAVDCDFERSPPPKIHGLLLIYLPHGDGRLSWPHSRPTHFLCIPALLTAISRSPTGEAGVDRRLRAWPGGLDDPCWEVGDPEGLHRREGWDGWWWLTMEAASPAAWAGSSSVARSMIADASEIAAAGCLICLHVDTYTHTQHDIEAQFPE